jgi:hypothetical protein
MAEDLAKLWGKLSLDEGEVTKVAIQPRSVERIVSRGKFCVIGKLLTERFVGKDSIKRTLVRGWRPQRTLSFKVVGDNVFIVEFEDECDKIRVLEGRPWIFDGNLFSVEEFDGRSSPAEIVFEQAVFWVRMLNLPLACMGKEVGYQIGSTMGMVEDVDTDEEGVGWGKSLRVRVKIDLTKPLARGRVINLLGKQTLIAFQYEKLPKFCFDCGRIWHGRLACTVKGGARVPESEKQYGTWLRVPSPRRRRENYSSNSSPHWQEDFGRKERPPYAGEYGRRTKGSRDSSESGGESFSRTENSVKTSTPVSKETVAMSMDATPAKGGRTVMEGGINYGVDADMGEILGAINEDSPISGQAVSPAVMGNIMDAKLMEQIGKKSLMAAVKELNLKGKEKVINENNIVHEDVGPQEKKGKEKKVGRGGVTRGENRDGKITAGEGDQTHVGLRWKRRARAGQQWSSAAQPENHNGKRKMVNGEGKEREEGKLILEKRMKYKGGNEALVLRDEVEIVDNGSGMAGSDSQPRRPV